jgi:hypothetical protein
LRWCMFFTRAVLKGRLRGSRHCARAGALSDPHRLKPVPLETELDTVAGLP